MAFPFSDRWTRENPTVFVRERSEPGKDSADSGIG